MVAATVTGTVESGIIRNWKRNGNSDRIINDKDIGAPMVALIQL